MTRMQIDPRSVASNRTRRSSRGRIGAAALALFGFALGACDSDGVTGPRTGGSPGTPYQPVPVECTDAAFECHEPLL